MNTSGKQNYFEQALSDFTFDAAAGRAIRHLVDCGYTSSQILKHLDYPVPEAKIQKTVYRYLTETGILVKNLPDTSIQFTPVRLENDGSDHLYSFLLHKILQNGEENSFMSCPFGLMISNGQINKILSPLTAREREYILGIAWEPETVFHRMNRRMLEIGAQLAVVSDNFTFCFLRSEELVTVRVTPDSDVLWPLHG